MRDCDISGCGEQATKRVSAPGPQRGEFSLVCAGHVAERMKMYETHSDMTDMVVRDIETETADD